MKSKDEEAIKKFLEFFGISNTADQKEVLKKVAQAFSKIPYENLTKISEKKKIVFPSELLEGFFENGTGGTCFPLVYLAKKVLDFAGIKNYLVLAHRKYAPSSHCLVVAEVDGQKFFLDVGYSIFEPIKVPESGGSTMIKTVQGTLEFSKNGKLVFVSSVFDPLPPKKFELLNSASRQKQTHKKFRYVVVDEPVDEDTFFDAWLKTFEFEMMNHTVVVKLHNDALYYIKDRFLHRIRDGKTEREELDEDELKNTIAELGIRKEVFERAKSVLK